MPETLVREGTTARLGTVAGDLRVGKNSRIVPESGRKVVVAGAVVLHGRTAIDCDLECQSLSLEGKGWGPEGDVTINGGLEVHGSADVDATLRVSGELVAGELDVAGHLKSGQLQSGRLRVGGHLETRGSAVAGDVDVGGHMKVHGAVTFQSLRVGGHAEVGGGTIAGEIKARGHVISHGPLRFGTVQTYGHLTLPRGSVGERLSVLGKVEFEGDAVCRSLEVTGDAMVHGDCDAAEVEVKGNLDVKGKTRVQGKLRVFGTAASRGAVESGAVGVSGRLTAERVSADSADIVGEVNTSQGLKARSISVGKASTVTGALIGEVVDIGKEMDFGSIWGLPWWRSAMGRTTSVEDIYAKSVRVGSNSRARRVCAEVVRLEDGAIADEVVYTKELDLPKHYHLAKPPVKTAQLPQPGS